MKRRIPEVYTIMLARTDKEPFVVSMQPITLWLVLASMLLTILFAFVLGWNYGKGSDLKMGHIEPRDRWAEWL